MRAISVIILLALAGCAAPVQTACLSVEECRHERDEQDPVDSGWERPDAGYEKPVRP